MISVDEISKITEKRNRLKKETYTRIYEQISNKIRKNVEFGNKQLFAEIPAFVVGYPTFDRLKATQYIKRQLELGGFQVSMVNDYEIYITWNVKKNKPKTKKEPQHDDAEFGDFPSFVNLKKAANKYRGNAKNNY